MRIFLTGATGYIGSAVLEGLLRAGHKVTALVRDPEKAERVSLRGAEPLIADLSKPVGYAAAAAAADGIVHTAFESSKRGVEIDRLTIDTLLRAATGPASNGRRFLLYTSGVWVLGTATKPADESAPLDPAALVAWRPAHEELVLNAGRDGALRTAVIRPGIVYGGSRGIIGDLLKDAGNGLVRVIGTGKNYWPCIYERDLADLYVRLAAHAEASGVYHANDEADEQVNDIVEAIANHAKMRPDVRHVPLEEARAKLGDYADALALDQRVRSPRARALGWTPTLRSVAGNVARLLEEFRNTREAA